MFLKKLSLSGFKTFADDTHLEFGPGITAIVGPNGSGKSNIVDAILWSLGERSHKALRGHGPTDVIFNGAQNRKPMGLAEVSLFFDNEDKSLSLEFPEIQVTRRVFRDGDSDYSLNKANCRLKDVLDLFLDTGLGPEAYSVVSQREIDSILSAKPEDRRALLEGAAGVQKYRARRDETRRKLARVDADLLRIYDITHELRGQVEPLEKQAELAREYENYVARLRVLQLAVLARDYEARQKRLEGLRETLAVANATRAAKGADIARLEADEAELETRGRQLGRASEELQAQMTDAVSRLKATEGQLAVSRERRRALSEQQEFQAQEIGLLRARATTAAENLKTARAELEAAVRDSASLSDEAARAEARLGEANARLQEATRELQKRQTRVIEQMRAGQARASQAAGARAEAEGLQNRAGELERLLASLDGESSKVAKAIEAARGELEATKAKQAEQGAKVQAAREGVERARAEQSRIAAELNALREKKSGTASRLGTLRELEESLEGVQGGPRAVLKAAKRGELEPNYTLVADAIRAPKELELAIEVALGGNVNNLICLHDADAKAAIGWLKKTQSGRATFLPLSNIRASGLNERTLRLLDERGVRGLASELVERAREHDEAIDYLLGRFIVVETLDLAIALAKRCESGARLVTLEGEVVLPAGAITGGQGRQKTSGLLTRKREVDELSESLAGFDSQLATLNSQLAKAADAIGEADRSWRASMEAGNELRSGVARQEREGEHLERELRRVKGNREATDGQLRAIRENIARKAAQQKDNEAGAAHLETEARALDEAVGEAQREVAKRQSEREDVAGSVAETRANYGALQERLNAMRRVVTEGQRQIQEAESGIASREANLSRASGEDAALVASESRLVSELAELQGRREELEASSVSVRAKRQEAMVKLDEAVTLLRASRAALHEAEEEAHRAEVRAASTEAEVAEMERRFAEEFETPIEDALSHRDAIESRVAAVEEIETLKGKIGDMGPVNVGAVESHRQVVERLEFLQTQSGDLEASKGDLESIIAEVDGRTRERFMTTFRAVESAFDEMFGRIFDGGKTQLTLTLPDNLLGTGVEMRVQLPGKGHQEISLLSGGERALTALAFMLALLKVNPSPFVVLDEVDAPLDQANVGRFSQLLREFTDKTQFIVITHNTGTMQAADVLYGVTMQQPGVSTLMSVKLVDDFPAPLNGANGHANGHANGRAKAVVG